jgi:hypothetical protein
MYLKTTIIVSISLVSKKGRVAKNSIVPTTNVTNRNLIKVAKNYGYLGTRLSIFLIILPLLDLYPVLIAMAKHC